jgi:hypothetical protein
MEDVRWNKENNATVYLRGCVFLPVTVRGRVVPPAESREKRGNGGTGLRG